MTYNDFVRGFLGLFPEENPNPETIRMLGSIADTNKDGFALITFLNEMCKKFNNYY